MFFVKWMIVGDIKLPSYTCYKAHTVMSITELGRKYEKAQQLN